MDWLGTLFLYLHIAGVIVGFGPTIAFPLIAAKATQEPMHGNFALRVSYFINHRVVEPGAVFVLLTGVALIITRGYNPLVHLWVAAAIVLFLIAFGYSNLVQLPTIKKMITLTSQPPPVDAPAGPPPEFVALSAKAARGGQLLTVLLFAILALMVVKPF